MRARRLLASATVTLGLLTSRAALAGNVDSFYLGNDAALQGGAITADVTGGGAIWYNPAGLAKLPGLRLDASASAYVLRFGGQDDIKVVGRDARVKHLTTIDFQIVPSLLTVTHKLGNVGVGLGVFVPNQHTTFLRTRATKPLDASGAGVDILVDEYERYQEYYAGPALGFSLHPAVDFGVSLLGTYRNQLTTGAAQVEIEQDNGTVRITQHSTLDWQQFGLQVVLGLQLRPSRRWRIGFTSRPASFRLVNVQQRVELSSFAVSGGDVNSEQQAVVFHEDYGVSTAPLTAPRFHAGTSYEVDGSRLALDLNYQQPLLNEKLGIDTKPVLNARLGGRHRVTETLTLGGGLFTDVSPERHVADIGQRRANYYGVTLAADLGSPYLIANRDGERLSPPKPLLFGTTLALSYALGLGTLVQGQVGGSELLRGVKTDFVAHELTVHLGTSLAE